MALPVLFVLGGCSAGPSTLATMAERVSRRSSSADPAGGNADSIESFAPGTTHVLLDTDGPGMVTHIWMTLAVFPNHRTFLRDLVLRMYWERSDVPSVEVPLGDFFALGHCKRYPVQSAPIAVGANLSALNCYWPMPFHDHARIEIHNAGLRSIRRLYYHVDYELGPIPPNECLFHAVYHRDKALRTQSMTGNTTGAENYVILDTRGRGHYVGCVLFVDAEPGGWWGEGDDMIFLDDAERPTIVGTGSEDYFGNAWGFQSAFCYPYYGAPLLEKRADGGICTTVYRWHIPDPVRFRKRIRVTIEHIFRPGVVNDYASVAYWYQREPIRHRPPLPPPQENYPRHMEPTTRPASFDLDGTELEADLRLRGVAARAMTATPHEGYKNGGWLRVEIPGERVEIPVIVAQEGRYRIRVKPVNHLIDRFIHLGVKGGELQVFEKRSGSESAVPYADLGVVEATNGLITLVIGGNSAIGIDHLRIEKVGP